ncbi:hypothetical protein PMIN06_010475 [Paraphaeosphaeria minitans]
MTGIEICREERSPPIQVDAKRLESLLGSAGMEAYDLTYSHGNTAFLQQTSEILPKTPSNWPTTFIAQGDADTNCPLGDTKRYKELLWKLYPDVKVNLYIAKNMTHAYDYVYPETLGKLADDVRKKQIELAQV